MYPSKKMCGTDVFVYMLHFFEYMTLKKSRTHRKKTEACENNKSNPPKNLELVKKNQSNPPKENYIAIIIVIVIIFILHTFIRSSFGPSYKCPIVHRLVQSLATTMANKFASMVVPAAAALQENLDRLVPQIREVIDVCRVKAAGRTQPSVDQIVKMSLAAGLAVKRKVMPRNTGIHPENRGKTGWTN